jgi:hypothetical protein
MYFHNICTLFCNSSLYASLLGWEVVIPSQNINPCRLSGTAHLTQLHGGRILIRVACESE